MRRTEGLRDRVYYVLFRFAWRFALWLARRYTRGR